MGIEMKLLQSAMMLIAVLASCDRRGSEQRIDENNIVVVNYSDYGREKMAGMIRNIQKYNPKVIGINAIFGSYDRSSAIDVNLAEVIHTAGDVTLVYLLQKDSLVHSDSKFVRAAKGEGVLLYGLDEEGPAVNFQPFVINNDSLLWTFGFSVLSNFDPDMATKIMSRTGESYEIQLDEMPVIFDSLNVNSPEYLAKTIRGKIVLMGYLGPRSEDMQRVKGTSKPIYSTIVQANIISCLLKDKLVQSR